MFTTLTQVPRVCSQNFNNCSSAAWFFTCLIQPPFHTIDTSVHCGGAILPGAKVQTRVGLGTDRNNEPKGITFDSQ
jgi:hypothetical protein